MADTCVCGHIEDAHTIRHLVESGKCELCDCDEFLDEEDEQEDEDDDD